MEVVKLLLSVLLISFLLHSVFDLILQPVLQSLPTLEYLPLELQTQSSHLLFKLSISQSSSHLISETFQLRFLNWDQSTVCIEEDVEHLH